MNRSNIAPLQHEPTHDEIALCAFLLWEKEGRQPGRESTYWLEAEAQLRLTRLQFAEKKAVRPWPPQTATTPVARKLARARAVTSPAPAPTKLAAASRNVAVKPASVAKTARKTPGSASSRKDLARN